jgi:parallel beta-helix repeat protein
VKKLVPILLAFLLVGVAGAAPSVVATTETSATVQGLDCGSKYRFSIRKYMPDGSLNSTATYVYPATKSCPDTQPPSIPQGLAVTGATKTSISLSWQPSTDNIGVAGYNLYRNGVRVGSSATTAAAFDTLQCGVTYTFGVDAFDVAGNRSQLAETSKSTTACDPVPLPSCAGVVLSPGNDVQAAINANASGTVFCLRAGVYRLPNPLVLKSGVTLQGEPGAVLDGSRDITALLVPSGGLWVATGQTQQQSVSGYCDSGTACQYRDDVYLDGAPLRRVLSLSEVGPGRFYFDYAADRIYIGDNPAWHRVEAAVTPLAIKGWGTGVENATIRSLIVQHFAGTGIQGRSSWKAENNEVRWNHRVGIQDVGTVRNNKIHHNGQIGYVYGGPSPSGLSFLLEGNEIVGNNYAGYDGGWEAGGAKFMRMSNLTVRNNSVRDNDGPGLWTDWNNRYILYDGNVVENNSGPGIFHEASYDAVIRNNTVRGNGFANSGWLDGAGILLNASPNVEIYANTVADNNDGIGITQTDRGPAEAGFPPHQTSNLYVHDNTITMRVGHTGLVTNENDTSYYTSRNNRFQNNRYTLGCNSSYFAWQYPAGGSSYAYITPAQWRAAGQDAGASFSSVC